jgi:hypothetical protein
MADNKIKNKNQFELLGRQTTTEKKPKKSKKSVYKGTSIEKESVSANFPIRTQVTNTHGLDTLPVTPSQRPPPGLESSRPPGMTRGNLRYMMAPAPEYEDLVIWHRDMDRIIAQFNEGTNHISNFDYIKNGTIELLYSMARDGLHSHTSYIHTYNMYTSVRLFEHAREQCLKNMQACVDQLPDGSSSAITAVRQNLEGTMEELKVLPVRPDIIY